MSYRQSIEGATFPRRASTLLDPETFNHEQLGTSTAFLSKSKLSKYDTDLTTPQNRKEVLRSTQLSGKRSPSENFTNSQLRRMVLSGVSTLDTLPTDSLQCSLSQGKEFVPTKHLTSDSFPQFPSIRQAASTPSFLADRLTTDEREGCEFRYTQTVEQVTLSDIIEKLYLLIRTILFKYKYFWFLFISICITLPWILCLSNYIFILITLYYGILPLWNTIRAFLCSLLLPTPLVQDSPAPVFVNKQRLRDLPQYQPIEAPQVPATVTQLSKTIPLFLRWCPIGNFGESDIAIPSIRKSMITLPQILKQKQSKKGVAIRTGDLFEKEERTRMIERVKCVSIDLCRRLLSVEAQDAALSSAFAQIGLRYVVEHPLTAFYSLDLNDISVVNLNDRHFPPVVLNLCNSLQPIERQIGEQLLGLLVQRRQLEKYLIMTYGDQRITCLKRLAQWYGRGLEKEYSPYCIAISSTGMTDGDLLHHLLFTWLAQQLPPLKTDVFSRTHLAIQPAQTSRSSWDSPSSSMFSTIVSIQKFPTDFPSVPGTFYKITQINAPTKTQAIDVSWDDFGVIEGVAVFLLRLKNARPDVVVQVGVELGQLLED